MGSSLLPWNGADKDTYCLKTKRNLDFSRFPDSVCERIRTPGLLIRSQTLYPAELRTHMKL